MNALIRRLPALIVWVAVLAPSGVFAQSPRAGVVTTLEGNVTVRRIALPAPAPLKFKDDVFLQDTVTTGDGSLARMLLGGKAVVTIRERSVLTITEIPGKSTIDLESGKFALAVAREKMRPGEEVIIRTPNAIAGVRGTVVVTEVTRQGAQAGGQVPAVLTNFYVLRGTIVAQQLDPATRQPTGTPLPVGTLQGYSQAGGAAPRVAPVPPEQVPQITAGLQPSGPKGSADAAQEQVKAQAVQTAVSLAMALTGAGDTSIALVTTPAPAVSSTDASSTITDSPASAPVIPPVAETAPAQVAENLAAEQLGNIVLSGTQVRTGAVPVADVNTEVVSVVGGRPLIAVAPDADVTLDAGLITVRNSLITGDGSGFDIRGRIRSTYAAAFIDLDPTTLAVAGNFVSVIGAGAELTLAGPLLHDVGGSLVTGIGAARSFVAALDGGVITSMSSDPLIWLTGSTIVTGGSFFNARRSGATPTRVSLGGPLLDATGAFIATVSTTQLDQSGAPRLCCSLFGVGQGAQFTSTTSSPLLSLVDTAVLSGQHVFVVFDTTSVFGEPTITSPGMLHLAGPLLTASGSTTIGGLADFLGVFRSSMSSTTTEPLVTLLGTSIEMGGVSPINGSTTAGRFLDLSGNAGLPATLALNGPLLRAVGVTLDTTDDTFGLFGEASLASTGTSALIAVEGGAIGAARDGSFFIASSSSSSAPTLSLAGPLLVASNTTLANGTPDVVGGGNAPPFIAFRDGARATSTSSAAFVSLTGTVVESAGNFFDVRRNAATVSLAGPLLAAVDSTIDVSSLAFASACCNLVRLGQGAVLTSTSTTPLIQLVSSAINAGPDGESGANIVRIADVGSLSTDPASPSHVTLAGPLLAATDGVLSSLFHTLAVERSTLTSTTTAPLIQLTTSKVVAGGTDPFSGTLTNGGVVNVLGSATSGSAGAATALTLAGPLLNATSSEIAALGNLVGVFNGAVLTGGGGAPLISLAGSSLTLGGGTDDGDIVDIQGVGGTTATARSTVTVPGGLAGITGGGTAIVGGYVRAGNGGQLVSTSPTQPLVFVDGGTHSVATSSGRSAIRLTGRAGNTADELASGNLLSLGTDQPLQHAGTGAFVDVTGGATVTTRTLVSVDTALLQASAPLLRLSGAGTSLTSSANGLDLVTKAKLTSTGPLFRVEGGTLAIVGDAVRVMNGSYLNVGGDLFHITGGGQVVLSSGAAIFANGGSVVTINGGIVNFASGAGTFVLANTLCAGSCVNIGGVKVLLQNGAVGGNVSVTNPIKNAGGGSTSLGPDAAFIVVNGATTKVTVSGN